MTLLEIDSLRTSRRTVLKAAGAGIGGLVGMSGSAAANGNGNGKGNLRGRRPLEEESSTLAVYFPDHSIFLENNGDLGKSDLLAAINNGSGTFDPGVGFDTTELEVTGNGNRIHHELPLPGAKPYVLAHKEGGLYTDRGAVINFELDDPEKLELPLPGVIENKLVGAVDMGVTKFRAAVSEYVQLYGRGEYFNWSVTRVDIFARRGMEYLGSAFIVLWDENDGSQADPQDRNQNPDYRTKLSDGPSYPDPNVAFTDDEGDWKDIIDKFVTLALEVAEDEPNPGSK